VKSLAGLDVSRETLAQLKRYEYLLNIWNHKINLVANSTLKDAWTRHFVDSAQVYSLAPKCTDLWVDLGSGGGFPGLVVAIMSIENKSPKHVMLLESDARKCIFLQNVIREIGAPASVVNQRVETVDPLYPDVISARALTNLSKLFELSTPHAKSDTKFIFMKGKNWRVEVDEARSKWNFNMEVVKSKTNDKSVIICAKEVSLV